MFIYFFFSKLEADQRLEMDEIVKMLTNQDLLKNLQKIQQVAPADSDQSTSSQKPITLSKILPLKDNLNPRSKRKQKLHQQFKIEEEQHFPIEATRTLNVINSTMTNVTT
jgi:hypothetical protein